MLAKCWSLMSSPAAERGDDIYRLLYLSCQGEAMGYNRIKLTSKLGTSAAPSFS